MIRRYIFQKDFHVVFREWYICPYRLDAFPYVNPETLHIVMLIISIDVLLTLLQYFQSYVHLFFEKGVNTTLQHLTILISSQTWNV